MSQGNTTRQKIIVRAVAAISTFVASLAFAVEKILSRFFEQDTPPYMFVGAVLVSLSISAATALFGAEPLINLLLKLPWFTSKDETAKADLELCGKWTIDISYSESGTDRGDATKTRTGLLDIRYTLLGLHIEGQELLDKTSKKMVVHYWSSDFVQLLSIGNDRTILYTYRIFRPDGDRGVDKIGYVVARQVEGNPKLFTGQFYDTAASPSPPETLRTGEVMLYKH